MLNQVPFMHDFGSALRRNKSLQLVIAIIVASVTIVAGWWAYSFYTMKKTQKAHQVFVDCYAEFEKNMSAQKGQARWDDVARAFDIAYQRYGSSVYGPAFLAYKATALIHNDKLEDAIPVMQKAVDLLKHSSLLYPSYALKLALMKIDSTKPSLQQEGQTLLKELADDDKNPQQDAALYYAGAQALLRNDRAAAKTYFGKAVKVGPEHSGFRHNAQIKLDALK
jgi:predicted negative regulator of RcsB-dependent stress response